jgi:hypothetical protein
MEGSYKIIKNANVCRVEMAKLDKENTRGLNLATVKFT